MPPIHRSRKGIRQTAKSTGKATVKSAKGTVKTTQRSIKTAEQTARTTVKTTQVTAQAAKAAARKSAEAAKATAKATVSAVKAIIAGTKALITALLAGGWIAVVIILIIVLLGCAVSLFGGGSSSNSYTPVSAEVEAYEPLIRQYAAQHGIPEYVELIKAVMMQESGGRGNDPMQASECGYNTRYPNSPNGITDPEYSMDVGIQNLAACLSAAEVENPIDMEHIKLALLTCFLLIFVYNVLCEILFVRRCDMGGIKGYISIREAFYRWGVSERRVNQYCADGRIPGASRFGRSWAIPEDAKKPADPRIEKRGGRRQT